MSAVAADDESHPATPPSSSSSSVIFNAALIASLCAVLALYNARGTVDVFTMSAVAINSPEAVAAVAAANQEFSSKVYPHLSAALGADSNLAASPFSLSSVMAMLHEGAAGPTREQVGAGMAFSSAAAGSHLLDGYRDVVAATKSNENFTLDTANKLYVQRGYEVLAEYLDKTAKHFGAEAENVDFVSSGEASRTAINAWVEDKTNKKIRDLLPAGVITPLTRLVLVNAVYFKSSWADRFDEKATDLKGKFTLVDGTTTVEAAMMRKSAQYSITRNKEMGCDVLEMPYREDRLSMLFFLPTQPSGFRAMEDNIGKFDFAGFKTGVRKVKVELTVPRFKLETTHQLNEPLKSLGMTDMFDPDRADFSALHDGSKSEGLHVSAVMQKAFVEVNEEGTEAAAATGAVMMVRSLPMAPPRFTLDRPFMFAIRDALTGMVLFVGRVMDPSKQ